MNPVVTPVEDNLVVYTLTDEDRKRLRNVKLMKGGGEPDEDFAFHRMCIQQTIEMITEKPEVWDIGKMVKELREIEKQFDNGVSIEKEDELAERAVELRDTIDRLHLHAEPICVSLSINQAMIELNDRDLTPQQRGRLKSLVETIMNTCPVKRTVKQYKTKPDKVEEKRYNNAPEFKRAERYRHAILHNIHSKPFNEALKLIERAAAVYKVTEAGLPGSEDNPIVVITAGEGKDVSTTDAPTS